MTGKPQNLQDNIVTLVQGKMLGGSSSLHHMMHTNGDPEDYNNWANITKDEKWAFKNIQKYFKKMETLINPELLTEKDLKFHGTKGPMKVGKDEYKSNQKYLEAFKKLGHNVVSDINSQIPAVGYSENLFEIGDEVRQSSAYGYLGRAKKRPNLCLSLFTTATEILFKGSKAIGVQVTNSSGEIIEVFADREVIVSAGAINSPKLLMLSGIGPKDHLTSLGIDVIADLPVGQNFQDHACASIMYQVGECDPNPPAANPHKFPAPSFNGYVALDNKYADYDTINLEFQCESSDLLQLSVNMFSYAFNISDAFFEASKNRKVLFTLLGLVMPKSRGQVLLKSSDPADNPVVHTGMFSDEDDIDLIARAFMDHNRVLNVGYFKEVNAKLVDVGVCQDLEYASYEYWRCYAISMSATMWHYAGTCAMGTVLDSDLRVKGVNSLRVVDASSMPTVIRAKIYAGVMMLAEHGADIIRDFWKI